MTEIKITLPDALPAGDYVLNIAPVPPTAGFSVAMDGLTVTITDKSTGGTNAHYGLNDGTSADCKPGGTIVHTYPDTSARTIKQTVTNSAGDSATASKTVYPKIVAPNPPPPPPPPPSNNPPQVPPPATGGEGAHTTVVTATIDGKAWTSTAKLGDDPSVAGPYLAPADADGNPHPGLRSRNWVDGVDVGAMAGSGTQDYAGHLHITYDGAVVFDQDVQFPRGVANQTVRYGPQAAWHTVDPDLFPNLAQPTGTLPLMDLSGFDLSYNGLGVASYANMAAASDRQDIDFVTRAGATFCAQPSDESFAVVRTEGDTMPWGIYFIDDNTGHPFHVDDYPNTCLMPYGQVVIPDNPIAPFPAGMGKPSLNGTAVVWNVAHETGYHFVAAAATGSARDKWHAGVWANAMLTAINPPMVRSSGKHIIWYGGLDTRGNAWALRSVFLASFLSDEPDYYAAQLEAARIAAPQASADNPCDWPAISWRPGSNGLGTGNATWMDNYLRVVSTVVAHKLPTWQPIAQRFAASAVQFFADARYIISTAYVHTLKDADHNYLPDLTSVYQATLRGPAGTSEATNYKDGAWSEEDIAVAIDPSVTPQALDALMRKYQSGYASAGLGDFWGASTSPYSYPAWMRMAIAGAVDLGVAGADAAWEICNSVPTKPDYTQNWARNIVPRAAA